ncbi:hypothetical protein HG536_0D00820 [Torulaspora globosa]|uniref:COP9 signalosome complex subunit 5 n=1 Tax=Torulaspora globosa TaxID=48254 RepID=A0A7G3ZGC4_9SACH|nr:uncharacterized protein HG536_0D00820 [Torulaspora globosa]QLL32560.1 hypothetical protein HG536_0D00820 [Torulaspora globosa]
MLLSKTTVASLDNYDQSDSYEPRPIRSAHSRDQNKDQFLNHQSCHEETPTQHSLLNRSLNNPLQTSSRGNESWKINPRYFSSVQISRLACLKILAHAVRGGAIEIMGTLIGATIGNQFIVFDCFELPVEGTETRVNAQSESYEYMVQYMSEMVSAPHTVVGWYHSHPGYDCWLSNIDMHTQDLNQKYQDPYLGIVVDPVKSLKENRLAIGAFRTMPSESAHDGEDSLQFYELKLFPFQSELDDVFDPLKISFNLSCPASMDDSVNMGKLVDIMRQWNSFYQTQHETPANRRDQLTLSNLIKKFKEEEQDIEQNSQRLSMYSRRTHSNSLVSVSTSGEPDSDVDMNERHPEDAESLNSSSHTMTESLTPLRRQNLSLGSALRRPWPHTLEMSFRRHNENPVGMVNGPDALQRNALLLDYDSQKKEILRAKIKEYRRLRYYRDAFTL